MKNKIKRIITNLRRGRELSKGFIKVLSVVHNPIFYYLDTLLLLPASIEYKLRLKNGLKISIRPNTYDLLIFYEIFVIEGYKNDITERLTNFTNVVDLGGQAGMFSLYCYSKNKNLNIKTVEATLQNFVQLEKNLLVNNHLSQKDNLLFNAAWSNTGEELFINLSDHNTGGHSILNLPNRKKGNSVKTISLKEILGDDTCDLLKIDIEGAEYEVLYGADKEVFDKVKNIILEVHPVDNDMKNIETLHKYLSRFGYNIRREHRYLWATR